MTSPSPLSHEDAYCVIGNPVAHSRSPWIHRRFAQLTGQRIAYTRELAPLDAFTPTLQQFLQRGGRGCNITVPFKLEAAALADTCSDRVTLAGAANTLVRLPDGRLHADNTDGLGLVADISRNADWTLRGCSVLLVGAGGASAGALGPLLQAQVGQVVVTNRTASKAQALRDRHASLAAAHQVPLSACGLDALAGMSFDLVINASSSSLSGSAIPVPEGVLRPGGLGYDMMYGAAARPFIDWAVRQGAHGRDGLGMLVEQAAESFALWRGVRPPSAQVLQELRQLIAAGG